MESVLVIDDAGVIRAACSRALEKAGYRVVSSESGEKAVETIVRENAGVVLLDLRMPGLSGLEVLEEIKSNCPEVEVVIITAYIEDGQAYEAIGRGASELLLKPFESASALIEAVHRSYLRYSFKGSKPLLDVSLEALLKHSRLLSDERIASAKKEAAENNTTLAETLGGTGVLESKDFSLALADYLNVPFICLKEQMITLELLVNFPSYLAYKHLCFPLSRQADRIMLAISNPFSVQACNEIKEMTGLEPVMHMAYEPEIQEVISHLYTASHPIETDDLFAII